MSPNPTHGLNPLISNNVFLLFCLNMLSCPLTPYLLLTAAWIFHHPSSIPCLLQHRPHFFPIYIRNAQESFPFFYCQQMIFLCLNLQSEVMCVLFFGHECYFCCLFSFCQWEDCFGEGRVDTLLQIMSAR